MKILHCADIHLDSKLNTHLDREKSSIRRAELLCTFSSMVEYAALNDIHAVLICGDLFDTDYVTPTARNAVTDIISSHPGIDFFYLKGNHGNEGFLSQGDIMLDNLHMFDRSWKCYKLSEEVCIYGAEMDRDNKGTLSTALITDDSKYNIVMLHGQESVTAMSDNPLCINIREYRNKGIDYLALGHIHSYRMEKLDERGSYVYPGCLEGRGFDECGDHGFVVLDIDTERRSAVKSFISFAKRRLYTLTCDVSDCDTSMDIIGCIRREIEASPATENDLLKIVLTGTVDVSAQINLDFIRTAVSDEFFYVKIVTNTGIKVDYESFRYDRSLKGAFVRSVLGDDSLDEETRATAIRYGLMAIQGEWEDNI